MSVGTTYRQLRRVSCAISQGLSKFTQRAATTKNKLTTRDRVVNDGPESMWPGRTVKPRCNHVTGLRNAQRLVSSTQRQWQPTSTLAPWITTKYVMHTRFIPLLTLKRRPHFSSGHLFGLARSIRRQHLTMAVCPLSTSMPSTFGTSTLHYFF